MARPYDSRTETTTRNALLASNINRGDGDRADRRREQVEGLVEEVVRCVS